jgi:hypothetical protein
MLKLRSKTALYYEPPVYGCKFNQQNRFIVFWQPSGAIANVVGGTAPYNYAWQDQMVL